jgi:hypothetical protein
MNGANVASFGDDGLGSELAHLELGPLRVVFRFRLVVPNRRVLVARQYRAAFFLSTVGGALCGIWANCKSFLLALRRRAHRVRRGHPI